MSAPQSSDFLESLLKEILLVNDEPDHEKILEHVNQVLKSSRGNLHALHTKIVALLHLDRHEDAAKLFESNDGKKLVDIAPLERAYSLYKVGNLEKAVELAEKALSTGQRSRAFKHIAAQAYYRLENFEETAKLCALLIEGPLEAPNEKGDLRVNTQATNAQLIWSGKRALVGNKGASKEDLEVFEATFNAACLSIAKCEYSQAIVLLKHAKQLCNALVDLTDCEKLAELEPVIAQEIYVLSRMGQFNKALGLIGDFDLKSVSDNALKVISAVNKISIKCQLENYNPYLTWQKYSEATKQATSLASRPFSFQYKLLRLNEPTIDLGIGKTNAAKKKVSTYQSLYPTEKNISIVNAAVASANMAAKDVIRKIQELFAYNSKDVSLALTLIQLRMNSENITGSIEVLEKLFENVDAQIRYQPGLVGLMVALLNNQGRKKHVRDILYRASKWWLQVSNPNDSILRAAGKSMLQSDNPSDLTSASELFSSLLQSNPSDKISVAGLVSSFAVSDTAKKNYIYVDTLTSVATLISGIDVSALEITGVAQPSKKQGVDILVSSARHRKVRKKPKLPKNFDPSKKVDLERWLPMRDRSYYKPKGRKDKKKTGGITQGGPAEESMELAGGGRVDVVKVDQVKKTGGGGGTNKKKKKKGGKW